MKHYAPFLPLWTLAVLAAVAAFVLHLALRSRSMNLGYELGRTRAEQGRLREVRRVLELEVASYETPQRVESIARSLLGMEPPNSDQIVSLSTSPRPSFSAALVHAPAKDMMHDKEGAHVAPTPRLLSPVPAVAPVSSLPLFPRVTLPQTALAAPSAPAPSATAALSP